MSGDDFEPLLKAVQAGDESAWHSVVAHYSPGLLAYIRRVGAGDPEDALSEVWISAARTVGTFRGAEPAFRSWLYVIAHRRAIDEGRKAQRAPVPTDDVPDESDRDVGPEQQVVAAAVADDIQRLLDSLSPDQRAVILLRVLGDFSLAETADVLGKRVGAVKALQRRALESLRRRIEDEGVSF